MHCSASVCGRCCVGVARWQRILSVRRVQRDLSCGSRDPLGHVILVDSAYYGRLSVGLCVTRDYGFVGCFVDVLAVLARLCSGRRQCVMHVARLRQLVRQPCPNDLTVYLDVHYRCVPGTRLAHRLAVTSYRRNHSCWTGPWVGRTGRCQPLFFPPPLLFPFHYCCIPISPTPFNAVSFPLSRK